MKWYKTRMEFHCCKCGKAVKPGRKLGHGDQGGLYCWHCGHNLELAGQHRVYGKADAMAMRHMRLISGQL